MGRHFESTQLVEDRPLFVSLSKMSADNSYQNKNTPALQAIYQLFPLLILDSWGMVNLSSAFLRSFYFEK